MKNPEKGISLYLAIIIITVLTSSLLALVSISVSQIKIIWSLGDSVNAFYAADTGAERVLYDIYKGGYVPLLGDCPYNNAALDGASYQVCISSVASSTIWSTGSFKNTQRRIEISF
jgi:hypothetical protein